MGADQRTHRAPKPPIPAPLSSSLSPTPARHNFFNINRWMVDDLREILTTRNRARLRTSRMTHRFANVYSFLAVPTHIVNP